MLLALIQMKYQNSGALVAISRVNQAIPNNNYPLIAMLFSDILGALACSLLAFILVPPFGVFLLFLCALVLIRALHGSYRQIFELLQQADPQTSNGNSMEQEDNGGVPIAV